jgi:hypothetical protein
MRDKPRSSRAAMLAVMPLALVAGLYLYAGRSTGSTAPMISHGSTPQGEDAYLARLTAWYVTQDHVKEVIGNPFGLRFFAPDAAHNDLANAVKVLDDGRYHVEGWLESNDRIGRHQFICDLKRHADGSWSLVRLQIVQPV